MANAHERLRAEFNEWAEQGRGEEMEHHHESIASQTIERMHLHPAERVLDLGCGAGWATRRLAQAVQGGTGLAVGLDISDEMINRTRQSSEGIENILFVKASADQIPFTAGYFHSILSIESFYYYPDQEAVLRELYRILAPSGSIFILINLYKENPYSLRWVGELNVPVHARSEREYQQMLRDEGFECVEVAHIPDLTPTPDEYSGKWFRNADELRDFKRIGALLLCARKPGGNTSSSH